MRVSSFQLRRKLRAGLLAAGVLWVVAVTAGSDTAASAFSALITAVDHWIAFVLLAFIGGNMIKESFGKAEELNDDFGVKTMLLMAIATSIDALAVGITFAFLEVQILPAAGLIGVTTFLLSFAGIYIGNVFGAHYKSKAELAGGIILVLIGVKILLEHLGILSL